MAYFSKWWAKCVLRASVCFCLVLYFPVFGYGHAGTQFPLSAGFSFWVLILGTNAPLLAVSQGHSDNTIENLGNVYFRKLKCLKVLGRFGSGGHWRPKGVKMHTFVHQDIYGLDGFTWSSYWLGSDHLSC